MVTVSLQSSIWGRPRRPSAFCGQRRGKRGGEPAPSAIDTGTALRQAPLFSPGHGSLASPNSFVGGHQANKRTRARLPSEALYSASIPSPPTELSLSFRFRPQTVCDGIGWAGRTRRSSGEAPSSPTGGSTQRHGRPASSLQENRALPGSAGVPTLAH
jgi:hypothetical protein